MEPLLVAVLAITGIIGGWSSSAVLAQSTPVAAVATARDAGTQPFAPDSPWNMPLASTAAYDAASACTKDIADKKIGSWINSSEWSLPVYNAKASDPLVSVYMSGADTTKAKPLATIRIPAGAQPGKPEWGKADYTDAHLLIIDADGKTVHEMWRAKWLSGTKLSVEDYLKNSLTGSGIGTGGVRAYGGSALGGLIRAGELSKGIPHAVALAVPRAKQRLANAPVWPATEKDSGAAGTYLGAIPMGQLLALPANLDLSKLGLSAQGKVLAAALQNYGAYDVDSSDDFSLYVEQNAAKEVASTLAKDWNTLRPLLVCVGNNTAKNVGGGTGSVQRRAALAPALK